MKNSLTINPSTHIVLPGLRKFPDGYVQFVSVLGSNLNPSGRKTLFGDGIYQGEARIFPLFSGKIDASFPTTPVQVDLFRHNKTSPGNIAHVEMLVDDIVVTLVVGMTAYVQIQENITPHKRFENFITAYRNCPEHDFRQASEIVLNPYLLKFIGNYVKANILQSKSEQVVPIHPLDWIPKIQDWFSQLTEEELLDKLGLKISDFGEIKPQWSVHNSDGEKILAKLKRLGVTLNHLSFNYLSISVRFIETAKVLPEANSQSILPDSLHELNSVQEEL